ncbi:phage terminase large subunit [Rhizobium sp. S152]|uniref:phage terminase large subunit n=1 Tax=Rhizobium sp. S152 TaxID=3055038 RepID=UPI0025A9522D|nr:phage terminase large subunit [Rhizobium sp. S152]MDM9629533.1 phage terminase large subunit [Rhizobium sp. S152]
MLYGGSRSGKTFINLRSILVRALAHRSRHAVLRYRFNHVKQSVVYDTLPKVLDLCFPGVAERSKLDKTDWFLGLPNGSEVWFGGLDDKERTEKILGQEYASIFLNECSQISWASRNMAITRLAQKTPLRLKTYYDCNPPPKGHWTYKLFIEGVSPDTRKPVPYADQHVAMLMNPEGNKANLASGYLEQLQAMPERMRLRFLLGQFADDSDSALWSVELLEQSRLAGELPDMLRIIIAVDPSGCSGDEDTRSDEIGIVVCGLGVDGKGYIIEDLSGRYGPSGWGRVVADAFDRHEADRVVAETNFGGAMVGEIIRVARPGTPFTEVRASRGKVVRAEPIASLFDQGKVIMAGYFPEMEDQLLGMSTAGYTGSRSPDRADAMVWGVTSLFPALTKREADPLVRRTVTSVTSNSALKAKLRGKRT